MKCKLFPTFSSKTKYILLAYLLLIIIGQFIPGKILSGGLIILSPIILLVIVIKDKSKEELDGFLVFMVFMTLQLLYFQSYVWFDQISNSNQFPWRQIILSAIIVIISSVFLGFLPKRYYSINIILRRTLFVLYIVVYYLYSLLMFWILAWAGII